METNFNFKSQICTTREQSERLIALGLKKETADMCYAFDSVITQPFIPSDIFRCVIDTDVENKSTLPAWSLHRLLMMLDSDVQTDGRYISLPNYGFVKNDNIYDNLCDSIEWLIKEGYFNKEYLV